MLLYSFAIYRKRKKSVTRKVASQKRTGLSAVPVYVYIKLNIYIYFFIYIGIFPAALYFFASLKNTKPEEYVVFLENPILYLPRVCEAISDLSTDIFKDVNMV